MLFVLKKTVFIAVALFLFLTSLSYLRAQQEDENAKTEDIFKPNPNQLKEVKKTETIDDSGNKVKEVTVEYF